MPSMELFVPFVAISGGARVCSLGFESELALRKEFTEFVCPDCSRPLFLKWGAMVAPHFSHFGAAEAEACGGPGESGNHLRIKAEIFRRLKGQSSEAGFSVDVGLEVQVPDAGRVADVMVTFPGGARHAHEIQLSPISLEDLIQRTESYYKAGVDVTWYFGSKLRPGNSAWLSESEVDHFVVHVERPAEGGTWGAF